MDIRNSEPEVKRDLQGNVIGDTGVNENLIELMRNRPDFAGQIFEEDSTEAEKALGGFEDKGALNRFNKVHPVGGMPAPGGTGIGSKVYDFLQSIGFGTK